MYLNCTNLCWVYVKCYSKNYNFKTGDKTDYQNYWGPSLLLSAYRIWSSALLYTPKASAITYQSSDAK
jgi:hypothetical protein